MRQNAINNLYPNVYNQVNDKCYDVDGNSVEVDESKVSIEVTKLQAEYDALQYQRDRQYPSIGDQLDMQYHDQLNGTTTWQDAVAKVKSDNPK